MKNFIKLFEARMDTYNKMMGVLSEYNVEMPEDKWDFLNDLYYAAGGRINECMCSGNAGGPSTTSGAFAAFTPENPLKVNKLESEED